MVTFPPLGTTENYALFANMSVSNTGPTLVSGNVGAGVSITGFSPSGEGTFVPRGVLVPVGSPVNFMCYADALILDAALAAEGPAVPLSGNVAGQTLVAGVYSYNTSATANGILILDGQNSSSSVWVFQIAGNFTVTTDSSTQVINEASACNVFWRIAGWVELHTDELWIGSLIAQENILFDADSDLIGTAISLNGNITVTSSNIVPCCEVECPCPVCGSSAPASTGVATTGFIG